MGLTENMLDALKKNETLINMPTACSDSNGDHDFSVVLDVCETPDSESRVHTFRYPDGKEEAFSFGY